MGSYWYGSSDTLPESKRGLKFHAAAIELNFISDEFFEMRNHNPEYLRHFRSYFF